MKFARDAAQGGMEEVELGKIAVRNASSDAVKQFGQRMADDHSKAGIELKSWAATENVKLPAGIDAKQSALVRRLSGMRSAELDRAYMRDMVKDHENDIAQFQKEASSGSDRDLQGFASKTLPTLRDHLRMAKETSKAVGAMSMK